MANTYSGTIRKVITSNLTLDDGFTDEEKNEIIDFLEDICVMRIHTEILDKLPQEDKDGFYEVSEHRDIPKIKAFLEVKLPSYMDIVQDVARKTVEEFIRLQKSQYAAS